MTFTPPSSIAPSTVTVAGTVSADVTDRPARLLGVIADIAATIDADVTDRAERLLGVVSVDSLPLPDGAATEATLATAAEALNDVGLTALLERGKIAE